MAAATSNVISIGAARIISRASAFTSRHSSLEFAMNSLPSILSEISGAGNGFTADGGGGKRCAYYLQPDGTNISEVYW